MDCPHYHDCYAKKNKDRLFFCKGSYTKCYTYIVVTGLIRERVENLRLNPNI